LRPNTNYVEDIGSRLVGALRSNHLARGASFAFGLQVAGAGFAFILQVLLGRWLGTTGYGIYVFTLSWAGLVAIAVGLGLPTTVLRFIPAYLAHSDWSRVHGILKGSLGVTLVAGVGTAVAGTVVALYIYFSSGASVLTSVLGFCLAPLLAIMALQQEAVKAFRYVGLAFGPALVFRPLLVLLGAGSYFVLTGDLSGQTALLITDISIALLLLLQAAIFWFRLDSGIRQSSPRYEIREWLTVAFPMLLIVGFNLVLAQTDIVLVGAILGSRDAGLYGAATKVASLVSFVLVAVNAMSAPLFSSLYARGEHSRLQGVVSSAAQWIFWPSLVIGVSLGLLAPFVLRLFGPEFSAAHWVLVILLIGQLVNATAGPVGYLMILTGHQRGAARVYGVVAALHLLIVPTGIFVAGLNGAALATMFSVACWNIWLYRMAVQKLSIRASIF
jgi:O-antigen/teichoic acid export membrane protein